MIAITARTLHVGDGTTIDRGVVLVEDGKIVAVGAGLEIPEGAELIRIGRGSITPGLVDANAMVESLDSDHPLGRATRPTRSRCSSTTSTVLCDLGVGRFAVCLRWNADVCAC